MNRSLCLTTLAVSSLTLGGCDLAMDILQDQLINTAVNQGVKQLTNSNTPASQQQATPQTTSTNTNANVSPLGFEPSPDQIIADWGKQASAVPDQVRAEYGAILADENPMGKQVARAMLVSVYSSSLAIELADDRQAILHESRMLLDVAERVFQQFAQEGIEVDLSELAAMEPNLINAHVEAARRLGSTSLLRQAARARLVAIDSLWSQYMAGEPRPGPASLPTGFEIRASGYTDLSVLDNLGAASSGEQSASDQSQGETGSSAGKETDEGRTRREMRRDRR